MFGFGKPKQVAETEADGEIERVYHEIKQGLHVSGIKSKKRSSYIITSTRSCSC